MNNVLIQMQILANWDFWFPKTWLFYIIGSISRFLLKSPSFETTTTQFYGAKGLRGLEHFWVVIDWPIPINAN